MDDDDENENENAGNPILDYILFAAEMIISLLSAYLKSYQY